MKIVKEKGGARIGWVNASWPLASLKVTEAELILNATILGKLTFKPSDVQSIEVVQVFPLFKKGIKINHRVRTYNTNVLFWSQKKPEVLIKEIEEIGFLNPTMNERKENDTRISKVQKTGGFPLKPYFAISIIILWNLFSLVDVKSLLHDGKLLVGFGKGFLLSSGVVLCASILLLVSKRFQKFALKEGMEVKDFSMFIYFITLIVGILFLAHLFIDL